MARMSEPQMVEALTSIRTSPWPGTGTGTLFSSTVLFPGRNAAFIVLDILNHLLVRSNLDVFRIVFCMTPDLTNYWLCGSNDTVDVPKVFPRLIVLPKEHLPLDEPAIAIQLFDHIHVVSAERVANHTEKVGQNVLWVRLKRGGKRV